MTSLYTYLAARLVRAIVSWCTARGRYVDYVHAGRTYMRRYILTGYRTGDRVQGKWRARLPNLYLHHMCAPDADPCLHDHPWPWAVSWIVLGGYREEIAPRTLFTNGMIAERWHRAPALNVIRGTTFHRVAELEQVPLTQRGLGQPWDRVRTLGVYTLFLAGPRAGNKAWGYLVPGRGFVHQSERHAELSAVERRPRT